MDDFGFTRLACDMASQGVARIVLAREAEGNPLDNVTCAELVGALSFVAQTDDVRVALIGHRGPVFSAGGETVSELNPMTQEPIAPLSAVYRALRNVGKPTIAVVDGRAQGSGFGLAIACDFTLASERAAFSVPEITRGLWSFHLMPDLVRIVGRKRALRFLALGATAGAAEAHALGLVTDVLAPEALPGAALALARRLADASPTALRLGIGALRAVDDYPPDGALDFLQQQLETLLGADDTRRALESFRAGKQ